MGNFIRLNNDDIIKYHCITNKGHNELMALQRILNFYKFYNIGANNASITYFDISSLLLYKNDIAVSIVAEESSAFIKVEKITSKQAKTSRVYTHKIKLEDKLADHAFFVMDAIKGMFDTNINADLENIIKAATPILEIRSLGEVYEVISGDGFRCHMNYEKLTFTNFMSKKKYNCDGLILKHNSLEYDKKDFVSYKDSLEKYCKSFVLAPTNIMSFAFNVTEKVSRKVVKADIKKAKAKILEDKKFENFNK